MRETHTQHKRRTYTTCHKRERRTHKRRTYEALFANLNYLARVPDIGEVLHRTPSELLLLLLLLYTDITTNHRRGAPTYA